MANKKLKEIMTNLAAGHISKKEADELIKDEKVPENKPKTKKTVKMKKDTHKRKKSSKLREVK